MVDHSSKDTRLALREPQALAAALRDPARLALLRSLCMDGPPSGPVFNRMTRLAARLLGAPVALGTIVDHDRQVITSAYDAKGRYQPGSSMPLDYSFCQYAVAGRRPFVVEHAPSDPVVSDNKAVTENNVMAYAGIPLVVSGESLGSLCVLDFVPRKWTDEQLETLSDLAAGAAAELELHDALREAKGRAAAEETVRRLEAVQRVTDVAISERRLDALLDELLLRVRDALRADTATLFLLDEEDPTWLVPIAAAGLGADAEWRVRVPVGRGIAGRIAASGQPQVVADVSRVEVITPAVRQQLRSLLGVPLRMSGSVAGVLHVGTRAAREFNADDVHLLEVVAERAAGAIERARLSERERAARIAAEAANRAKSEFLAVMSHELRTPLNAIGGYTQLLAEGVQGAVTDQQRESLGRISRSQAHLLNMIDRILRFVEADAGRARYTMERVELAEVLRAAAPALDAECRAKGLTLAVEAIPGIIACGDRERIDQILNDLTTNAVKFTPAGGRIVLSCSGDDACAVLTVRDTGTGIPAARMGELFGEFVQMDQSKTRRHDGMGIGLALSRAMARGMNGDLTIDSVEGVGTAISLRLPRDDG